MPRGLFTVLNAAALALFPVYFIDRGMGDSGAASTVTVLFLSALVALPVIGFALDGFELLALPLLVPDREAHN